MSDEPPPPGDGGPATTAATTGSDATTKVTDEPQSAPATTEPETSMEPPMPPPADVPTATDAKEPTVSDGPSSQAPETTNEPQTQVQDVPTQAPEASEEPPTDVPPASEMTTEPPTDVPPASETTTEPPTDVPPASETTTEPPTDVPPAPETTTEPSTQVPDVPPSVPETPTESSNVQPSAPQQVTEVHIDVHLARVALLRPRPALITSFSEVRPVLQMELYKIRNPILIRLEYESGFDREYLFYFLLAFLTFYLMFGRGNILLSNFIVKAYPSYQSLMTVRWQCKKEPTQWLAYWCAFALLSVVDHFITPALGLRFSLYLVLKTAFLVYLQLPYTYGAHNCYVKFVHPLVERLARRRTR